jgi:hypothetical protein
MYWWWIMPRKYRQKIRVFFWPLDSPRGSAPKSILSAVVEASAPAPTKKKAAWSAAKRQAQGERMKAYWAKRSKAAKK